MDTLSHALWGKGLFSNKNFGSLAFFFGAMPDLFSFGIFFILKVFEGDFTFGKPPEISILPDWLFFSYDFTHSFIVSFLFIGIVFFFKREFFIPMFAWPFHILLDFPFHSEAYFPTKIFWPLDNFYVDGIPWSNPKVWFSNLAGLIFLFAYRKFKFGKFF